MDSDRIQLEEDFAQLKKDLNAARHDRLLWARIFSDFAEAHGAPVPPGVFRPDVEKALKKEKESRK
jgi:hypothetical protein